MSKYPVYYYLYCIGEKARQKFSLKGIDGKKLYSLPHKNIRAVVTEVNIKKFDPEKIKSKLKSDLKWTEEKVKNHQAVIEEAMRAGTVIPLKFLTLYKSKENLNEILERERENFEGLLNKLKDKAEWGLKVYVADKERFIDAVKKEDEEIIKMKEDLALKPEGVRYFLEKMMAEKISEKVDAQLDKYGKEIFKTLSSFSTESPAMNKLMPKELTGNGKEMVLNASYLILNEKSEEFKKTVARVHDYYFPKGLWLEYAGPFPPYSFVEYGNKNKKTN